MTRLVVRDENGGPHVDERGEDVRWHRETRGGHLGPLTADTREARQEATGKLPGRLARIAQHVTVNRRGHCADRSGSRHALRHGAGRTTASHDVITSHAPTIASAVSSSGVSTFLSMRFFPRTRRFSPLNPSHLTHANEINALTPFVNPSQMDGATGSK